MCPFGLKETKGASQVPSPKDSSKPDDRGEERRVGGKVAGRTLEKKRDWETEAARRKAIPDPPFGVKGMPCWGKGGGLHRGKH